MALPGSQSESLVFGDNPFVAIVSLWTPVEMVAKRLDKEKYGIIGNLYSCERGLDSLFRSLLANPDIQHLVVTGSDLGNAGKALSDFFEKGFSKATRKDSGTDSWQVNSSFAAYLELDIPQEALEELRSGIHLYRWELTEPFPDIPIQKSGPKRKKWVLEKRTVLVRKFFGEFAGFVFRGPVFAEPWIQGLDALLKFGYETEKKRSLFNPVFCLSLPSKKPFEVPDFFPFSEKDCDATAQQWKKEFPQSLFSRNPVPAFLTISFLEKKIELQLHSMDNELVVLASLSSASSKESAQLLATFQSFFSASDFSSKTVGVAVTVLDFFVPTTELEKNRRIVEENFGRFVPVPQLVRDFRGSFVVYLSQGEIVVEHLSPRNELLFMYSGKTALALRDQIIREGIVGTIAHALYLGTELQKAETALKLGIPFVQDKPLDFSKKK